jgi:S1-C subfamily serine protease
LTDLALLKIEAKDLTPLPLADSDTVAVGDPVFAVGNPFKVGMTATRGMVSAVRRTSLGINGDSGYESFIQTDASINPGNSGGALVNHHGQLCGINTAIWGTREGNIGIGFAIPSNLVRGVISQLAETGQVMRGFFGLQTSDAGRKACAAAGLAAVAGAQVDDVMAGGPADKAGLKTGDIITGANGKQIITRGDLRVIFSLIRPGESVALNVQRGGKQVSVQLTAAAPDTASNAAVELTVTALPGLKFRKGTAGLLITKSGKAATKAGLNEGREITEINGTPVTSAAEAEGALHPGVNSIKTKHGKDDETLAVKLPLSE